MFNKFVDEKSIINSYKYINPKLEIKILTKYLKYKKEKYFVDKVTGLIFNKTYFDDEKQIKLYSKNIFKKKFTENSYSSNIPAVSSRHKYVYDTIKSNLVIKNKKILDIGAGDGSFLNLFQNKKNLFGLEPKKENCDLIKKKKIKYQNSSVANAKIIGKFDIATLLWTACNFNNPYASVKKISSFIKKNGYLVVAESSRILVHPKKSLKNWVGKMHRYFNPTHFSKNSIINLLKINGFEIKYINRYQDTDYLLVIGQNKFKKFKKFEIDNYKKIQHFFRRWEEIDKFLK